jgi:hypothetical protein
MDKIKIVCNDRINPFNHISVFCDNCGTEVYLSDSTFKTIKLNHPEIDLVLNPPIINCEICAVETWDDGNKIMPISELQLEDLKNK